MFGNNNFVTNLFKHKKIDLTMEQALKEQAILIDDCKIAGNKFAVSQDKKTWRELLRYHKALQTLTVHIQKYNAEGENNERIKERELLIRQLEVLKKAEENTLLRKAKMALDRFTSWLTGQARVNIDSLREKINKRIAELTTQLEQFNKREVSVVLA